MADFYERLMAEVASLQRRIERLETQESTTETGAALGDIRLRATSTVPVGWLLCYGQAVSRTTYADLFAEIGTTFGSGDGSTTFNVPDLRGRLPLGRDNMGGSSANRVTAAAADSLGGSSGAEDHTLTESEMPSHTHPPTSPDTAFITRFGSGSSVVDGPNGGGSQMGVRSETGSTGGDTAHNNMPPYMTLDFMIYAGV